MAINKTINIDVNSNIAKAEKEVEQLEKKLQKLLKAEGDNADEIEKLEQALIKARRSTTAAGQALDQFGGTLEDVGGEGVQPLSFAIGELEDRLYELAAQGLQNSDQFKQMSQTVASMKKTIIDVDMAVDGMSQTMAQKVGGSLGGVAGGFELAQGAMAAFGSESVAIEEALLKVQSAMAISQGIQGIREAIPSFKSLGKAVMGYALTQKGLTAVTNAQTTAQAILNAVMNLNPVFLLITGVTALVAAIVIFNRETEIAEKLNEKLNKSYEKTIDVQNRIVTANQKRREHELKMLEATGASEEELHKKRLENIDKEDKERAIQLKTEKIFIDQKRNAYNRALKEGNDELAKTIKDEIKQSKDRYKDLEAQHEDYVYAKEEEDANYIKETAAKAKEQAEKDKADQKERLEKWKTYQANRLAAFRQTQDLMLELLKEGEDKELTAANLKYTRLIEDTKNSETILQNEKEAIIKQYELLRTKEQDKIRKEYRDKEIEATKKLEAEKAAAKAEYDAQREEFDQAYYENTTSAQQLEIDATREKYFQLITMAEEFGLSTSELERRQQSEIDLIDKEYSEKRKARADEERQKKMDSFNNYLNATSQGLQALDELNSFLTDEAVKKAGNNERAAEAARKKGFERSKKLQLSMAIIQGVQGVMAAFTAGSSMGPAGVVMGPVMAALAAVTAGINIAKIAKMKYEGGGGASVGGSTPSAPSVPSAGASFNVVGAGGANQLAQTLGGQNQEPIQAYVVSGEVTTAQSLDRNRIENASL